MAVTDDNTIYMTTYCETYIEGVIAGNCSVTAAYYVDSVSDPIDPDCVVFTWEQEEVNTEDQVAIWIDVVAGDIDFGNSSGVSIQPIAMGDYDYLVTFYADDAYVQVCAAEDGTRIVVHPSTAVMETITVALYSMYPTPMTSLSAATPGTTTSWKRTTSG